MGSLCVAPVLALTLVLVFAILVWCSFPCSDIGEIRSILGLRVAMMFVVTAYAHPLLLAERRWCYVIRPHKTLYWGVKEGGGGGGEKSKGGEGNKKTRENKKILKKSC